MKSKSFIKNCRTFKTNSELRSNSRELWTDILLYSSNLTGNWLVSKHIFYFNIVPTAEKNPAIFARWVKEMVEASGIRIKSKSEFLEAINNLRKLDGKPNKTIIRQALYHLFESGLDESAYSQRALKNSA